MFAHRSRKNLHSKYDGVSGGKLNCVTNQTESEIT